MPSNVKATCLQPSCPLNPHAQRLLAASAREAPLPLKGKDKAGQPKGKAKSKAKAKAKGKSKATPKPAAKPKATAGQPTEYSKEKKLFYAQLLGCWCMRGCATTHWCHCSVAGCCHADFEASAVCERREGAKARNTSTCAQSFCKFQSHECAWHLNLSRWKDSEERQRVLATMSLSEQKRRRFV